MFIMTWFGWVISRSSSTVLIFRLNNNKFTFGSMKLEFELYICNILIVFVFVLIAALHHKWCQSDILESQATV